MIVAVDRIWPDATIVIVGGGLVSSADLAYCRGKVPVMVINRAVDRAPWAAVFYSSDFGFYNNRHGLPAFAGLKYAIEEEPGDGGRQYRKWYPAIGVLRNRWSDAIAREADTLATGSTMLGRNSGAAAINLAVHLGASRIVLLGYTMKRLEPSESRFVEFGATIARMAPSVEAAGVALVNATVGSALHGVARVPLEAVVGDGAGVAW